MFFKRQIYNQIKANFFKGKILIILGPRRVGKTTILQNLQSDMLDLNKITAFWDCTDPTIRKRLTNKSILELQNLTKNLEVLFLDEAQLVENIGTTLKLLTDHIPSLQVIATGSSAFELANRVNEPLTGRHYTYHLYPISTQENKPDLQGIYSADFVKDKVIFGMYPKVLNSASEAEKIEELKFLTSDYLFKDILSVAEIKSSDILRNLLEALALQVGSEVSYTELGNLLGINKITVERYINLLEQVFIIFRLRPLSRNPRNEISKTKKIYFYDLGIRNSLIRNLNPIEIRNDVGALWENFLIIEKLKQNEYNRRFVNSFFWRTYDQKEIDYIEEANGQLKTYEFKWNTKKKTKPPKLFLETYKEYNPSFEVITPENWLEFVGS